MDIKVRKPLAKDGTEILEFCKQDKVYRMNSLYRPKVEADKFAQPFTDMEPDSLLLVFGYGNGIFPEAIMEVCREDTKVIFYEPEMAVWENIGNSPVVVEQILGTQGYLVTGKRFGKGAQYCITAEFPRLLEQLISYVNHKKVKYVSLPKYSEIFPEQFREFEERIQYRLSRLRSSAATAKYMGHDAVINNIMNLQYVPDSYCADSFLGNFPKDMPAIVVSAGPSLEKNVKSLKKAKGRALILCVDSAVKYLLRENVVPDLIVSVDPLKPLRLFDGEGVDGIPIVGSLDMNYRVLNMLPNSKVIFASTENSYVKALYQRGGHEITLLKSGGSVATFAFSLCLYWGFQTVILTGQDLALVDRQQYVGAEKLSGDRDLLEVEDIYGSTIYTLKDYYAYLKWFEQNIAMHPEIKVIDATEGGAKIAGTEIMTLEAALLECGEPEFNFDYCMKKTAPAFSSESKKEIEKNIQDSKEALCCLREKLTAGVELSRKGIQLAQQGIDVPLAYEGVEKEIQKVCEFYDTLDEEFLIQREIDATHLEEFMGLFENQENCQRKERYERLGEYFRLLLEATLTVEDVWENL